MQFVLNVLCLVVQTGLTQTLSTHLHKSVIYPSSCEGLNDGYHLLKLLDGDDATYPVIYAKCSNGFMVIDYSVDSDIINYFSSWDQWYRHYYGPSNDEHVNWQEWFLPSYYDNDDYSFLVSPDCSVCDETYDVNKVYERQSTYYLSGNLFGTVWIFKGSPNFEQDWETEKCYSYVGTDAFHVGLFDPSDREEMDDYGTNSASGTPNHGTCGHSVRSATSSVPQTHHDTTSMANLSTHYKPSIGTNGRYCVCVQPSKRHFFAADGKSSKPHLSLIDDSDDSAPQTGDSDRVDVKLFQADFESGTYRVKRPGTYTLMEDIRFNFGSEFGNYWPTEADKEEYAGATEYKGPFSTGWFAGMTIEADNVVIDLNGFTMGQSDIFYFQQRWFTVIEVGTQYFMPGQGPYNAGPIPKLVTNAVIKNGVLGPSSHHGIHGNGAKNLVIDHVHIKGFETHGIQLNGFEDISITNTEIGPTSHRVYVNGRYGHGRANLPRYRSVADEDTHNTEVQFYGRSPTTMTQVADEMEQEMNYALRYALMAQQMAMSDEDDTSEKTDNLIVEATLRELGIDSESDGDSESLTSFLKAIDTFITPFSINDDNPGFGAPNGAVQYGIFLNTYGASIFTYNLYTEIVSTGAYLENVEIHGMIHKMYAIHVVANEGPLINSLNMVLDAESVFANFDNWENDEAGLTYKGTVMTDAAVLSEYLSADFSLLGIQFIDFLTDFAFGDKYSTDSLAMQCNADTMYHTGKGTQGLRIDGVTDVVVKNIAIYDNHDLTELEDSNCQAQATTTDAYSMCLYSDHNREECERRTVTVSYQQHVLANEPMQRGFSGNMNQGININSATNVVIEGVYISDLTSKTGPVFGISAWPADEVTLQGTIQVENLLAGYSVAKERFTYDDYPNRRPEACAVRNYFNMSEYDLFSDVTVQDAEFESQCIFGSVGCLGDDTLGHSFLDSVEVLDIDRETNMADQCSIEKPTSLTELITKIYSNNKGSNMMNNNNIGIINTDYTGNNWRIISVSFVCVVCLAIVCVAYWYQTRNSAEKFQYQILA